jgi:hypothetical protein
MIKGPLPFALGVALLLTSGANARAQTTPELLRTIKAVGKEAAGNDAAARAMAELTGRGPAVLLDTLAAMKDASPVATNYLRAAAEHVFDTAQAAKQPLPVKQLDAFLLDRQNDANARRLAFELLVRIDPEKRSDYLKGMLNDPAPELRRDAVDHLLQPVERLYLKWAHPQGPPDHGSVKESARQVLEKAQDASLDVSQIKRINAWNKKFMLKEVDLTTRLGFITQWQVIGPFDNSGEKGFHATYAPEKGVDLTAVHEGKGGKKLRWIAHTSTAALGEVDFNKVYGEDKGVIAYGFVAVESAQERDVLVRGASNDAVKIFLNGKEVYSREEYHHGVKIDQHTGRGRLRAGRNEILIKVCQNEQTDDWARLWSFQLRVTDPIGGPVPLTILSGKQAGGQP